MSEPAPNICTPFKLSCGVELKNRVIKAATTEGLAHPLQQNPTHQHCAVYRAWAEGGSALIITGNVMVDPRFLECPRNVVVHASTDRAALREWAGACKANNTRAIVQLSHPGRQCPPSVSLQPVAPSAVPFRIPQIGVQLFLTPRELTVQEIEDIIERFVSAAKMCVEEGFDGVQIHSAHGYLLSQFLSPHINKRTDDYGGTPEKRRRLLMEIVTRVRKVIGAERILSVKLNSADFQKGGLDNDEAREVVIALSNAASAKIDFIEISGGTYENPVMCPNDKDKGKFMKESTLAREAYFLEFAEQVRTLSKVPLMVTGGFRTLKGMNNALKSRAADLIGLARPICMDPQIVNKFLRGEIEKAVTYDLHVGFLDGVFVPALNNLWHQKQIELVASGREPNHKLGYTETLTLDFVRIYFFDPKRHPTATAVIVGTLLASFALSVYSALLA